MGNTNGDKEEHSAYSIADICVNDKVDNDKHHNVHQQRAIHNHCGQFIIKMLFCPIVFHRIEIEQ